MPGLFSFGRLRLRWVAITLIAALLFMQFALASYVCPVVVADANTLQTACADHGKVPADSTQPQLCKAHCAADELAVGAAGGVDAPTAPLLLAVLDWRAALLAVSAPVESGFDRWSGAPPPGAPPRYLSLRILRR